MTCAADGDEQVIHTSGGVCWSCAVVRHKTHNQAEGSAAGPNTLDRCSNGMISKQPGQELVDIHVDKLVAAGLREPDLSERGMCDVAANVHQCAFCLGERLISAGANWQSASS